MNMWLILPAIGNIIAALLHKGSLNNSYTYENSHFVKKKYSETPLLRTP